VEVAIKIEKMNLGDFVTFDKISIRDLLRVNISNYKIGAMLRLKSSEDKNLSVCVEIEKVVGKFSNYVVVSNENQKISFLADVDNLFEIVVFRVN